MVVVIRIAVDRLCSILGLWNLLAFLIKTRNTFDKQSFDRLASQIILIFFYLHTNSIAEISFSTSQRFPNMSVFCWIEAISVLILGVAHNPFKILILKVVESFTHEVLKEFDI